MLPLREKLRATAVCRAWQGGSLITSNRQTLNIFLYISSSTNPAPELASEDGYNLAQRASV
jgi:hypothetical protein